MKLFLVILLIVAACVALLSVRLFFGKGFVKHHVDQNEALRRKGIGCVRSMDARMRRENPHRVAERSKRA